MALVMALTLLALLGLGIAGGLAHTIASQRATKLSQNAAVLDAAADRALGIVLGDPNAYGLFALTLGETRTFTVDAPDAPEISATLAVTRLTGGVLWMVASTAPRGDAFAVRRVNLVARFPTIGPPPPAALVTRGDVRLDDDVHFTVDTTRDADCAAGAGPAAIVAPGATVHAPAGIFVDTADAARDSVTYYMTAAQLAALAKASGVVHVAGDTTIVGGVIDGILLVDGSLTVRGTFAASGLIIVRGGVDASDAVLSLRGALLVYATPPNVSTILTRASVEYSPCVVARVMRVALSPRVVRLRSWAEFF
jgi:hypothetical protein